VINCLSGPETCGRRLGAARCCSSTGRRAAACRARLSAPRRAATSRARRTPVAARPPAG